MARKVRQRGRRNSNERRREVVETRMYFEVMEQTNAVNGLSRLSCVLAVAEDHAVLFGSAQFILAFLLFFLYFMNKMSDRNIKFLLGHGVGGL